MFNSTFEQMMNVDVSQFCRERDGMKYLPWANCKQLLHEAGAETVYFEPVPGPDGSSVIMTNQVFIDKEGKKNRCYETRIRVVIDDLQYEYQGPIMNGSYPVKDNTMSQSKLRNAQARLFVKSVAERIGLGFDLWLQETEMDTETDTDNLGMHSLSKCRERVERLLSSKMAAGKSLAEICSKLNITEEMMQMHMKQYAVLERLEKQIEEV